MDAVLQYIDLIVLAALAVVLFFIFKRMIGKKIGYQKNTLGGAIPVQNVPTKALEVESFKYPDGSLYHKMEIIERADSSFKKQDFIESAKKAFEMISSAFYNNNIQIIQNFVTTKIYDAFSEVVNQRAKEGKALQIQIKKFLLVDLVDIKIDENSNAYISVKYVTEQSRIEHSSELDLSETKQNQNLIKEITEIWTFTKNLKENVSIWKLAQTR